MKPQDQDRDSRRRGLVTAAAATSLLLSLIGGILVLLFSRTSEPAQTALKPVTPTVTVTTTPPVSADASGVGSDLSMFGFGDETAMTSTADSGVPMSSGGLGSPSGFVPGAAPAVALPALPELQVPTLPELPATSPIDWNALFAQMIAAQNTAQAANVTGAVVGGGVGVVNAGAVVLGDLILYSAFSNTGANTLAALQSALSAPANAAAATSLAAGLPPLPGVPDLSALNVDLSGLTAAFAAAAAAPPAIGMPALPELPQLPGAPDLGAALALPALGALALPALPPIGLPTFEAPRPPDLTPLLLLPLLGLLPSPTRMLGLPF